MQTPGGGYFLEPTVIADVAPDSTLAQEEIFGPVLAVIRVDNFEEGLRVANNTEYGLTGSLYTSDRSRIDYARREYHVGNLYFNRKCTGAMVGAHPFGGFNMSEPTPRPAAPITCCCLPRPKASARSYSAGPGNASFPLELNNAVSPLFAPSSCWQPSNPAGGTCANIHSLSFSLVVPRILNSKRPHSNSPARARCGCGFRLQA